MSGGKYNFNKGHYEASEVTEITIPLDVFVDQNQRFLEEEVHGGFQNIVTADTLDSVTPITFTTGLGKLVIVVNAGADTTGDITVTGTSVDRDSGAETGADTDTVSIDGVTTDASDTDADGNTRHSFTNAYITSKWFKGSVTLTTADVDLSDVDIYYISFEQWNDQPEIELDTLDITATATNAAAWLYAYLYTVVPDGDTVAITRVASIDLPAAEVTADRSYRLRRSNLGVTIDGATDGIFLDVHLGPNSQTYWDNINTKVWGVNRIPSTALITTPPTDHGSLSGLGDQNDHTWALTVDGSRPLTADWDAGSWDITAEQLYADTTTAGEGIYAGDPASNLGLFVGIWPSAVTYGGIANNAVRGTGTSYGFLQNNVGATILNAAAGQTITLAIGTAQICQVSGSGFDMNNYDIFDVDDITGNVTSMTLTGSTGAGGDLYLRSTTHATKGNVVLGLGNQIVVNEQTNLITLSTGLSTDWDAGSFDITAEQLYANTGDTASWGLHSGPAFVGSWSTATWAAFYNEDAIGAIATDYALIQAATGQTILNTKGGTTMGVRVANATILTVAATSVSSSVNLDMNANIVFDVTELRGPDAGGSLTVRADNAGDDLYLQSTRNATKGTVFIASDGGNVLGGDNAQFNIEAGAGANTLVVDSNSRVGIGTAAPTTKIEMSVVTADYFTLRSTGVNSTTGFQLVNDAQSWLFVVNTSDIFSITDNTGGTTPFVIETGAGNDTLVVDSNSRVGINTNAPSHELHVKGSSGTETIMLEDTSANSVPQFHIKNDARDWYLDVAGAGGGSNDEFRVVDGTAGTAAFVIKAAAPTNAFIINNTSSEVLTLTSTTAALLLPRMTTAQMNAIAAPVNGMIIYNTTVGAIYGYEAGAWANL